MARGIFEQLDWLTKKVKQLCCIVENGGGSGECTCDLILKTKSQIDSLVSSNGLLPGRFYRISNVCPPLYGGTDIIIQAATTNTFVDDAEGFFYNPKYANYSIWTNIMPCNILPYGYLEILEPVVADNGATGIFLSYGMIIWTGGDWSGATSIAGISSGAECPISGAVSPSYNIGDKVIWGGKVWENINGNVGSIDDDFNLNSDEWAIVAYNTNDYNLVVDEIKYNYENDTIYYRRDGEDNTSNIVDGYYEATISYQGVKEFPWGNTAAVFANRVSNSRCEIINFRGSSFAFNEISQATNLSNIISDTTSSIDGNIITDGYIGNCVLSQNSTISYNIMPLAGIYSNRLSHSSHIDENNISFSSIYNNFIDSSSSISSNILINSCSINNNNVTFSSNIVNNELNTECTILNNFVINYCAIGINSLNTGSSISNLYLDGYDSFQNLLEYNVLQQSSTIADSSYVYIANNNLFNSSIEYCSNNEGNFDINYNTLDNSSISNISSNGNNAIQNNVLSKTSIFYLITLHGNNAISQNNFFSSDFQGCTLSFNSTFTNNDFSNSALLDLTEWNSNSIIACRVSNSTLYGPGGSGLTSLTGSITNTTITDVYLNQSISGATYIYQSYSKTISLGETSGCVDPGPSPFLSYISVDCLTPSYNLQIVSYTA